MRFATLPTVLVAFAWLWLASLTMAGLLGADVRRHHFESAGLAFGAVVLLYAAGALRNAPRPALVYRHEALSQLSTWVPAVLAFGAFAWTLGLGPLSDDYVLADWARRGEVLPAEWPYVRPLPLALWKLLLSAGGSWFALHAVNTLLHALNAVAVGLLARRRLGVLSGVVAGAVFALFPAATEAVAWNAGVFDLMATSFVLLALLLAPSAHASTASAAGLALACAGGMASKETAVAIPALVALDGFLTWTNGRDFKRVAVPLAVSIVVIGAALGARSFLSPSMASHLDNLPDGRRQVKDLITRPYAALAVPFRTESGVESEHYATGAALLVILAAALHAARAESGNSDAGRNTAELLLLGLGWVGLASWPLLLQFFVSPTLEGSRYTYLPSVGLALLVAAALGRAPETQGRAELVAGLALMVMLATYAFAIGDERAIWSSAATQRDKLLADAASLVNAGQCGRLEVRNAPDNFRGVYMFREGLAQAIASLPTRSVGESCTLVWTGSELRAQ